MSDATNNMALWDRVCVTDPRAVKPITGKQYSGNSPKPYWIVQRLTEEFGPCGKGWGFSILNERMERLTDTDVLHVAVIRFWYVSEGERCELEQIGQTKTVYAKKDGTLLVDEDAPKKSVTDALVKCASYIGFAGDIFSGRWDDSRYVAWAREQYTEKSQEEKDREALDELLTEIVAAHEEGKTLEAVKLWYGSETIRLSNEAREYCWGQLREWSAIRSAIKANKPEMKAAA
jgi:hypothetical protein